MQSTKPIDSGYNRETRLALLEMSVSHIENTLMDIKSDIKEVKIIVNSQFKWLMGTIVGFHFSLLIAVAIKAFHLI